MQNSGVLSMHCSRFVADRSFLLVHEYSVETLGERTFYKKAFCIKALAEATWSEDYYHQDPYQVHIVTLSCC